MKARFYFVFAAIFASVLVACGGGGGASSAPPTVAPTASATPSMSPAPGPTLPANTDGCYTAQTATAMRKATAVGVQPLSGGNTFSYTGSLQQTTARVSPCPEPTTTASATVTVTVTVTPTASPGAPSGSVDEHSVELDAFATNTTQTTTDAIVANQSGMLHEYAETSTDLNGDTTATTFSTLGDVYAWTTPVGGTTTNMPPASVNQTLVDGSTFDRTYSGTVGAYSETDRVPGVTSASTITVQANAAATYTLNGLTPAGAPQTTLLTFSAPLNGYINVNIAGSAYQFANWIPAGPLYSDTIVDKGALALPSGCSYTLTSGETMDASMRTVKIVDPALGTLETRTTTAYNVTNYNGTATTVGPVCVSINDSEELFYDYLLDTPYAVYATQNGLPFQTVTLAETYGLSPTSTITAAVRRDMTASAMQSATANLTSVVAARDAAITSARSTERAQRMETLFNALRTRTSVKTVRPLGVTR